MEKNKKSIKGFYKKEGFYLALFLSLFLIAAVAVATVNVGKNTEQSSNEKEEFTLSTEDKSTSEAQKQNADRVENIDEVELASEEELVSEDELNVSSGTNLEITFNNPLDGVIAREYTYPRPQVMEDGTSRNIRGINIEAEVGTEVKSCAVGEVKEVSNTVEDGNYVLIAHANGISTKYSNLSKDIKVNIGDKVTEETVIGEVGESSKIFTTAEFGEHLNIQVQDVNGKDLDPTTYFTFNQE